MEPQEHSIRVLRTARYHVLGIPGPHIRHIWIVLHGYGQLSKYFIRHFQDISEPDMLIVAPEGHSRFYIPPGWTRVGASWMTREARETEIQDYVDYLDEVLASVRAKVPDDVRIILLGFSQGATTAWRWVSRSGIEPDVFVNWCGSIPDECLTSEISWEKDCRMMYIQSSDDEYITAEKAQNAAEFLLKRSKEFHLLSFEGNHRMDDATLSKVAALAGEL